MVSAENVKHFPASPGVYLMKSSTGEILYVGKAKSLRSRIRAYFGARDSRYQIQFLMSRVEQVEFIVTDTEKEALILENTLIKQHRPRYNFNLRDDKTYFSLRMDMKSEFPRLVVVRKVPNDGARYFGPYSSASAAREVLKQLHKIFPLRHYPMDTCRRRHRPCLFFQIRQCSAPCHGKISREDYLAMAEGAALFLEGRNQDLLRLYRQRMATASASEKFEEAKVFRDLIRSIEVTLEKQKMVSAGGRDRDVLGFFREGPLLVVNLMFIRGGTVTGSRTYHLHWELDETEGITSFLSEYYNQEVFIPDEILLPFASEDTEALSQLLGEKRGKQVKIMAPQRGVGLEFVQLAVKNAVSAAAEHLQSKERNEGTLTELMEKLHLPKPPRLIECYDISNIMGTYAVGSRVVFHDGKADKSRYRRYRIKQVDGANDFAMMHEVLSRRFAQADPAEYPDLIIVDGGIGQLNVLTALLQEIGIDSIPCAALAKGRVRSEVAEKEIQRSDERVFLPGRKNPVILKQNSSALLLLARIRDEAHRFAITYHKTVRGKETIGSQLSHVPGVGPKRMKALLRRFGSTKKLAAAEQEEIAKVEGMTKIAAADVWRFFHDSGK
jgi:excinuclease ABC subunit C